MGERGAGTILMIGLCALVAAVGVATTALGVLFDAREKAATAAGVRRPRGRRCHLSGGRRRGSGRPRGGVRVP